MISTIIVVTGLVLAVAYLLVWLAKPEFRRRIEAPKHLFTEQSRQYDEQVSEDGGDRQGARQNANR